MVTLVGGYQGLHHVVGVVEIWKGVGLYVSQ